MVQKLEKELKENEEYFYNYEKNKNETQEKVIELNRLNDKLDREKQEIGKELDDKNTSLDE